MVHRRYGTDQDRSAWESKEDVVMQPDPLALPTACYS